LIIIFLRKTTEQKGLHLRSGWRRLSSVRNLPVTY